VAVDFCGCGAGIFSDLALDPFWGRESRILAINWIAQVLLRQ